MSTSPSDLAASQRPFSVATWNINSLRMRQERLAAWLAEKRPDVVCLQELKMETALFPSLEYRNLGYDSVVCGQKTYNGVAILARAEHGGLDQVVCGLSDEDPDDQARLIAATIPGLGVRVMCAYVPNGQVITSDKFTYKLRWLKRLRGYLQRHFDAETPLLLCGDFNIAPDDRDVYDPEGWKDTVLCHPDARAAWKDLLSFGLSDALRVVRQEPGIYTYWDYQMLAFPKNHGLRIDHVLCTAPLASRIGEAVVDRNQRKGKKPSDHAPVIVRFT